MCLSHQSSPNSRSLPRFMDNQIGKTNLPLFVEDLLAIAKMLYLLSGNMKGWARDAMALVVKRCTAVEAFLDPPGWEMGVIFTEKTNVSQAYHIWWLRLMGFL